jgi:hypothetical protein
MYMTVPTVDPGLVSKGLSTVAAELRVAAE